MNKHKHTRNKQTHRNIKQTRKRQCKIRWNTKKKREKNDHFHITWK